jgi:hypothetical protein
MDIRFSRITDRCRDLFNCDLAEPESSNQESRGSIEVRVVPPSLICHKRILAGSHGNYLNPRAVGNQSFNSLHVRQLLNITHNKINEGS